MQKVAVLEWNDPNTGNTTRFHFDNNYKMSKIENITHQNFRKDFYSRKFNAVSEGDGRKFTCLIEAGKFPTYYNYLFKSLTDTDQFHQQIFQ